MRILIAYDGSSEAREAIDALPRTGLPARAEAVVITPIEVWPPLPHSCFRRNAHHEGHLLRMADALAQAAAAEALKTAGEGARRLASLFPEWSIRAEPCPDPMTPATLLNRAEHYGAECVLLVPAANSLRH